jgi:hypothetical protein
MENTFIPRRLNDDWKIAWFDLGGDRRIDRSDESDLCRERHAEHYAPPRGERVNRGKSRAGVAQIAKSQSRRTG